MYTLFFCVKAFIALSATLLLLLYLVQVSKCRLPHIDRWLIFAFLGYHVVYVQASALQLHDILEDGATKPQIQHYSICIVSIVTIIVAVRKVRECKYGRHPALQPGWRP